MDAAPAPAATSAPGALTRTLRVVSVSGGVARLEAPRAPACGSCAARAGCGAAALAGLSAPIVLEVSAEAPGGGTLRPGDAVAVSLPAATFLSAMALGWLLPPAALVGAAGAAAALGLPDLGAAALCVPVFLLSLLPLRRAERRGRMAAAMRAEAAFAPACAPDPSA